MSHVHNIFSLQPVESCLFAFQSVAEGGNIRDCPCLNDLFRLLGQVDMSQTYELSATSLNMLGENTQHFIHKWPWAFIGTCFCILMDRPLQRCAIRMWLICVLPLSSNCFIKNMVHILGILFTLFYDHVLFLRILYVINTYLKCCVVIISEGLVVIGYMVSVSVLQVPFRNGCATTQSP